MSSEIYYERAFIKLGEDRFIPLALSGSSNTTEFKYDYMGRPREVRARDWHHMDWGDHHEQMIMSEADIDALAEKYAPIAEDGLMCNRSRSQVFSAQSLRNWFKRGCLNACSVEEYVEAGDMVEFWGDRRDPNTICWVKTTEELERALEFALKQAGTHSKCQVSFSQKFNFKTPKRVSKALSREERRERYNKSRERRAKVLRDGGYAIRFCFRGVTGYFERFTSSGGIRYYNEPRNAKVFATEKEANRFIKTHRNRFEKADVEFVPGR